jgi:N-acetylmuramic acid 6-phosphate etherase
VVGLATDVSDEEIDAALLAAGGDARVAIVALVTALHVDDARRRLEGAGGVVRRALEDA